MTEQEKAEVKNFANVHCRTIQDMRVEIDRICESLDTFCQSYLPSVAHKIRAEQAITTLQTAKDRLNGAYLFIDGFKRD